MFNWVVRVVPQPPGTPRNLGEEERPGLPSSARRKKVTFQNEAIQDNETSEENSAQGGMITWISSGFAYALPQPAGAHQPSRANLEAKEDNTVDRQGVGIIGWIVQGLGKVVPQIDDKYKEGTEPGGDTEIQETNDVPDAEALPVVEVQSEEESSQSITPSMVDWIKKIIPQPEIPGSVHYPPAKVTSPPPEAQKQAEEETDVVGWFVKGLGRMVPQPVLKSKEDASEKTVVQNICICQQPGDLVVEEVEEQQEKPQGQLLREESSASTQVQSTQQEETEMHTEATTVTMGDSQEQMQAESEEVKLDSQAEGDRATHLAEESAQTEVSKLAEEATEAEVSKLAEEATEAEVSKLAEEATEAEGDQAAHLAEESTQPEASKLAEEATQASSGEQLANIQEEEMKEVIESQELMDPVEGTPLLASAETEPRVPEPKEAEPEKATKRDSSVIVSTSVNEPEPDVVTKQPDPSKDMHPPSPNVQEDETADEGCGVPTSCIAVRNWLMQMPHTSQCLANFNRLLQENAITLPSMPSKPSLGLMCESLPSLPSLPPQFSQLPQRVQQYYLNILSRLRPQQET